MPVYPAVKRVWMGKTMIKKQLRLIPAAVLALTLVLSLMGWDVLTMPRRYSLATTAQAAFGSGGQLMLIDRGKTALELLGSDDVLKSRMKGESLNSFYYAEQVAQAEDGTLYIADRAYQDTGSGMQTVERVLAYRNGKSEVIWQAALEGNDVSEQGAAILELQVRDGEVSFLRRESYGIGLYRYAPGDEPALIRRAYCGDVINDASLDLSTGTIVIAARRGYVRVLLEEEQFWKTVPAGVSHLMPSSVTARNGSAWVSDSYSNRVCRFSPKDPKAGLETVFTGERGLIDIQASPDGTTLLASDGAGFYRIEGDAVDYVGEVAYSQFVLACLLRACLAVTIVIVLWQLGLMFRALMRLLHSESALRVLLVVLASAFVSVFVANSLMTDLFSQEDDTLMDNMKLYAESVLQSVDMADLKALQWEQDYDGSAFMRVRRPMDNMLALAHAEEHYYTYTFYRLDGETVRLIMDSNDSVMCGQPYRMTVSSYIAEVQRSGRACALRTQNADGNSIKVIIPIFNEEDEAFATLEIALDLSLRNRARAEATVNMVLNAICATAVVVMLILEIVFLLSFTDNIRTARAEGAALDGPSLVPVRTLMFLIYTADCMQEAFIVVLCGQLYHGGLPFADATATALPISAEVLMMAVSSALCGQMAQRYGSRRVFSGGLGVQLAGFLLCPVLGSYAGIFLGKCLIGAGMGAVYVTCNTVASTGDSDESSAAAFAGVAAGTISGIAAGAGLSSVFLSVGGWRTVYLVGALFVFAGLLLTQTSPDVRPGADERAIDVQEISTARFFRNRRVPAFFLLVLVPFMMTPAYRVYFFPLYAQEQGLSDVRVGQIYLLCGLMVLYLGPKLSDLVMKRLGSFYGILAGSLLACGGMALFVAFPALVSVVVGILLVYAAYSFGNVCQYSYFQHLPECLAYGNGRSMSVYSVFENVGMTLGPMVFGGVMTLGFRPGVAVFSGGLLVLAILFAAASFPAGKYYD